MIQSDKNMQYLLINLSGKLRVTVVSPLCGCDAPQTARSGCV